MIPCGFMVYYFAFEIRQQKPPKENGKASGLIPTHGEFCGLDSFLPGHAHPPGDVGYIHQ